MAVFFFRAWFKTLSWTIFVAVFRLHLPQSEDCDVYGPSLPVADRSEDFNH
jgi:hypothetical protein